MAISTAVDASAVARVVGIKTEFKNLRGGNVVFLPQRVAVIGQGASLSVYATTKKQVFTALEVAQTYGFGSPLHLACKELLPVNGDGVGSIPVTVFPLQDDGSGVPAAGDVSLTGTATESGTLKLRIGGIESQAIVVTSGDLGTALEDAITTAINAILDMPVLAIADGTGNKSDLTAKWDGASGNEIDIEWVGSVAGLTLVITAMASGATNPDVQVALDQIGDVWETQVVNCMEIADTAALGKYDTFGEGRWGALTRKPVIVWTGVNETSVAAATAVSDARKSDRTNGQITMPASKAMPLQIAARGVARIAPVANNNPPQDYARKRLTNLLPGPDGDQWDFAERDAAIKAGGSSTQVVDGVAQLSDTVTFYHPSGDPTPAFRYAVDIEKVRNILFNLSLIFEAAEWDGAPLIPDDQATVNPTAKKPKDAKAAVAALIDSLALNAIISDPDTAKGTIQSAINGANPKRLDVAFTVQISGNTNIISVDFNFGFFFGSEG